MALPLLFLAALAALQPLHGVGRTFLSPMGEPFFGRTAGEDGLVAWFQQADRNHDSSISSDEMTDDAERFFETLDANHDGEIDPDEIRHYETVIAPHGGDDEAEAGRYGVLQIPEPVASADSDFNRGVSIEEFKTAATKRFQLLDIGRTGRLTLSELEGIRHSAASAASRPPHKPGDPDDQAILEGDGVDDRPPM